MAPRGYSTLFSLSAGDLNSEPEVETRFTAPLFKELGYPNTSILPKKSVPKLFGYEGSRKISLEVDFILLDPDGHASVAVEAKAPTKDVISYWGQAASYALSHNQQLAPDDMGIEWLLLTNGVVTALYPHDRSIPLVILRLEDFASGSPPFVTLKNYIRYKSRAIRRRQENVFETIAPAELNALFEKCHRLIWKKEKLNPTDAFYEFCKFVFIKIREDRKRREETPRSMTPLTKEWLKASQETSRHPVRDILFVALRDELERAILREGKKRIFETGETFRLSASTCRELIKHFENVNLSAIDEDLNGRMFERFLNQAVRGKELGQYFTPRPVVDFMTRIALHEHDTLNPPRIIDACAGTGGFLIEAMAYLTAAARNDNRLNDSQRETLSQQICNEHLFGVEANERVSRIARINMYLHGDGGSHIFFGEGLDSSPSATPDMIAERQDEVTEYGREVAPESFDLVLTNPPFSMKYSNTNEDENRILEQRNIAENQKGVKSNLLFIDRYHELLKPGGEILIILDDTVINGSNQRWVRDWMLEKFVVLGVHSLPFNAFFKAKANIKTSILHMRKKEDENDTQGHVFMSITNNIGHDNRLKDTVERNNLVDILMTYFEWKRTGVMPVSVRDNQDPSETLECPQQAWLVAPELMTSYRLDAFFYSPDLERTRDKIAERKAVGEVDVFYGKDFQSVPRLTREKKAGLKSSREVLKYFEIGDVTPYGLIVNHTDGVYDTLPSRGAYRVRHGDVLFAINNSSRGTVVLVPKEYDGAICTSGFLAIRPANEDQAMLLWYALRSEYCRSQIYYLAQTASQPELKYAVWLKQFAVPMPTGALRDEALTEVREFMEHVSALTAAGNVKLSN